MKYKKYIIFTFFLFIFFLLQNHLAFSQGKTGSGNKSVSLENPLKWDNIQDILKGVSDWLISFGAPIAIFMILVGAFMFLTSGGEPAKVERGKKTILWTIIGYGILLLGTEITKIVSDFFK